MAERVQKAGCVHHVAAHMQTDDTTAKAWGVAMTEGDVFFLPEAQRARQRWRDVDASRGVRLMAGADHLFDKGETMHALWYALPVTVVGLVVLFIVVGLRSLYKGENPPLWLQFACIVPFMLFSFRYWYLPIEIAAGMFAGIYDPFHTMFPGMAEKDIIPCTHNAYPCSVLSFDYPKHVAWTIGLFDGYTRQTWIPKILNVHILFNAIALCLFPWQLWLMQHGKVHRHRIVGHHWHQRSSRDKLRLVHMNRRGRGAWCWLWDERKMIGAPNILPVQGH